MTDPLHDTIPPGPAEPASEAEYTAWAADAKSEAIRELRTGLRELLAEVVSTPGGRVVQAAVRRAREIRASGREIRGEDVAVFCSTVPRIVKGWPAP